MKIAFSNANNLSAWIQEFHEFQLDSIFDTAVLGRAYEYINKVTIVDSKEKIASFQITSTNLYEIQVEMVGNTINATCTCPHDQKCKHIAAVILSFLHSQ